MKSEYEKLEWTKHDALGEITIYRGKEKGDLIFHKVHLAKSSAEHQHLVETCKKRSDVFHSNLMRLFA